MAVVSISASSTPPRPPVSSIACLTALLSTTRLAFFLRFLLRFLFSMCAMHIVYTRYGFFVFSPTFLSILSIIAARSQNSIRQE